MAEPEIDRMRLVFNRKLYRMSSGSGTYLLILGPREYEIKLETVKKIQAKEENTLEETFHLQCFNWRSVGFKERIFMPRTPRYPHDRYFVNTEEIFNILFDIHITTKHGKEALMRSIVTTNYANITLDMIKSFIKLCKPCQRKIKEKEMREIMKHQYNFQMLHRGQLEFIDLHAFGDTTYKYLLFYQDNISQFAMLQPIEDKHIYRVSEVLLDFFALLGAPSVLQSPEGRGYLNNLVHTLTDTWPGLMIAHSPMYKTDYDLRNLYYPIPRTYSYLEYWLTKHPSSSLMQASRYAQLMINTEKVNGMPTPYEHMFKNKVHFGIPPHVVQFFPKRLYEQEQMQAYFYIWEMTGRRP